MAKEYYGSIEDFNKEPTNRDKASKSLDLLFQYTKFHIGLYLTLSTTYIALASLELTKGEFLSVNEFFLYAALIFTMLAGFAGGVIISSITQVETTKTSDFLKCSIGPWGFKCFRFNARKWTYIEHTSFWLGLGCAVLSFVCIP